MVGVEVDDRYATAESRGPDGGVVQIARPAVAAARRVVPRWPAARIGSRLPGPHELDGRERDIGRCARRLPRPGPDQRHRVVCEEPRLRPDGRRRRAHPERLVGEDVRDDAILLEARRLPLGPRPGEVVEKRPVVDGEQPLVGVQLRGHEPSARERVEDRVHPRRHLRRGRPQTDPDLRVRLVEPALIAPHDRHRERHRPTLQAEYAPARAATPRPGPADRRPRRGPVGLDLRRPRRDRRSRDGVAGRADDRAHGRDRDRARPGGGSLSRAAARRHRRPERCGRADRVAPDRRVGIHRHARLPHLDDGGRTDLRRGRGGRARG